VKFRSERQGDAVTSADGLATRVHLAPERLDSSSTFQGLVPFGSLQKTTVEADGVDFEADDAFVSGTVNVAFSAVAGRDPGNAREGDLDGNGRIDCDEFITLGKKVDVFSGAAAAFAAKHAGKRVWVHGDHIEGRSGEHTDQPFFYDTMFSTVLTNLDDIEALCDQHYGAGIWDEYSLYLDDKLPKPLAMNF
jgi:hypothetical protein